MKIKNEVEMEFSTGTSIANAIQAAIEFCNKYKCELVFNHNGISLHINPMTDFDLAIKYWKQQS